MPPAPAVAALVIGLTVALAPAARAEVAVPVLAVQGGGLASGFELEGVLQAVKQSTLAAQAQGSLLALNVKAGERVKAGQVLARIDARDTQAGLQRAQAAVAQAQAELNNATVSARRARELRAQGFIAQAAVDQAENALKAAQAAVAQAQAAQAQAALAREFTAVLAPFDGIVLATHAEAGELAAPGRPIATVYAPGALRAVVQVAQGRSAQARAATGVSVQLPDGRSVAPKATQVLAGADPVAQTVEWRLDLPVPDAGLPGQSVRVRFAGAAVAAADAGADKALRLPQAAVLRRGELEAVYVQREQRFVLRHVRLGATLGGQVEVLAGLQPGERVAADALKAGLAGARPAP